MTQIGIREATDQDIEEFNRLPQSTTGRLIDFEQWAVIGGFINDTYFLHVYGTKPWLQMEVVLQPYIYVRRPEYWGIEVVGYLSGFGNPVEAPYHATLEVTNFLGTKGIELISATRKEQIAVP